MRDDIKKFTVTEDHIKLLQNMYWEWDDNYSHGSPYVNQKRPYGNSFILPDVQEILGIEMDTDEDEPYTEEQKEQLLSIHRGTQYALEIFLSTRSIEPGTYKVVSGQYNRRVWMRV